MNEPVLNSTADHPVESDVLLPDYCPDIARILNTEASAVIDTKTLETDRLNVSGSLCVRVIYVPDNSSSIRCFAYESAFTHSFEAQGIAREDMARVSVRVDYANVRPIGPRRLQIKASLSISARVVSRREEEYITGCEDSRVEMLSKKIRMSSLIGSAERPFNVEEELELGAGKPAVASIIRADAVAVVTDHKVIANKVIAKGELMLHTLYLPDMGDTKLEMMEHSIPISQIIDLAGVDENSVCTVSFSVVSVKVEVTADSDGENRILNAMVSLTAAASARTTGDFTAVSDAYSPVYEMDIQMKTLSYEVITDVIRVNETVRLSVEAPGDGLSAMTDCMVRPDSVSAKAEGKALVITGEMMVSAMAVDLTGGPVCIEKPVPFTINSPLSATAEIMRTETSVTVVATAFSLGAGGIDIRCECAVSALVFRQSSTALVFEMKLDDTRPRPCKQKTLTLYFADKGESLWEIAKRYNTSMESIMRENNLEADALPERSMLLIPKKHCAKGC